jgi:hypothetical protein
VRTDSTAVRSASSGSRFCERGDEFYDWDAHAFHFIGGMPLKSDGSMALYKAKEQEIYLQELTEAMKKSAQP